MNFDYRSFKQDGVNKFNDPVGTVQGVLFEKPIECRAYKGTNGDLNIAGFIGKYRTDSRVWPVNIFVNKESKISFHFGFDSQFSKHQASNAVYAPDEYFAIAPQHLFHPFQIEKERCHRCNAVMDADDDECSNCELEFAKKYNF